jgi:hypothetical protein
VTEGGTAIETKEEHALKVQTPIVVRFWGIFMDVSKEHLWKASFPTAVIFWGI